MTLLACLKRQAPLSLSNYMAFCLYHEEEGYYTTHTPLGRTGDFITAPEICSLFGETLALALMALKRPLPHLVELGGGRGLLMKDMAQTLKKLGQHPTLHMVEISPTLQAQQKETLKGFSVHFHQTLQTLPKNAPLTFVGNEFLDAFPIDQFVFTNNAWHERLIESDLTWTTRPSSFVPHKNYPEPKEGDICEYPTQGLPYFKTLLSLLKNQGGTLLLLDYGHTAWRYGDTLQALKNHIPQDPLKNPGSADLTSHVNFSHLLEESQRAGLAPFPLLTQGEFLKHYGILERLKALTKNSPHTIALHRAVERLINPREMGTLFKVFLAVN